MATRYTVNFYSAGDLRQPLVSGDRVGSLSRLAKFCNKLAGGNQKGVTVTARNSGVRASQLLKLVSTAANTVIEVNGVPFTALSGTATVANNEFDIAGADSADASALAAAINASTSTAISGVVTAAALGADTLTAATAVAGDTFLITLADGTKHLFTGAAGAATLGQATFSVDTGNNACATSIAAQINGYAPFSGVLSASASSAVVTISPLNGDTFTLVGTATTLAESNTGRLVIRSVNPVLLANALTVRTLGVVASGTVTYSSSSGTQTVLVNGVTVYNAAGASDSANAIAAAAAINASTDALVSSFVRALVRSGVVHILSKYPGAEGNQITLSVTGTGATASAARLASGTEASAFGARATGTVTMATASGTITMVINGVTAVNRAWATSDTATATAAAADINSSTDARVQGLVYATSAAGVVTISAVAGGLQGNAITLAATGTNTTASGARLTGGALPTSVLSNQTSSTGNWQMALGSESSFDLSF